MLILYFEGEKKFSEQLKHSGFSDANIKRILAALFEVSQIHSSVVELEAN